jgi:flagellar basal body-associated protein FliL
MGLIIAGTLMLLGAAGALAAAFALTKPAEDAQGPGVPSAEPVAGPDVALAYVAFTDPTKGCVVNLAEGRLSRYLKVHVILEVQKEHAEDLTKVFESGKKIMFLDWLISYLSDKRLDEVTGTTSIRRLKRDILDGFNDILATHAEFQIERVFFGEFNVQ